MDQESLNLRTQEHSVVQGRLSRRDTLDETASACGHIALLVNPGTRNPYQDDGEEAGAPVRGGATKGKGGAAFLQENADEL